MKSRSILLLLLVFMAFTLFGCGSKDANSDAAPGVTAPVNSATSDTATTGAASSGTKKPDAPMKAGGAGTLPEPGMAPGFDGGVGSKAK